MKNKIIMEWLCFKQHLHFSLRNSRYLTIALAQYFYSFFNWKKAQNLRFTFCTLQLIDDLLDGDRKCKIEPLQYIELLKIAIKKNQFDSSNLHTMTKILLLQIKTFRYSTEALYAFEQLIDIMISDRKRVLSKTILTKKELELQHNTTFKYSMDIVLIAIESPLRSSDMPEILEIFGWCSTVRDLEDDLSKDLINIPLEITSNILNFENFSIKQKSSHPLVRSWLSEETKKAKTLFLECDDKMKILKHRHGSFIFKIFLNSMKKYTRVNNA